MRIKIKSLLWNIAGYALALGVLPVFLITGIFGAIAMFVVACVCFYRADYPKEAVVPTPPGEKRTETEPYRQPFKVEFDDDEVRVTYEGKLRESVKWDEVFRIEIRIDDSFLPEPWWLLFKTEASGAMYPGSAIGNGEMLSEMQRRFPGFDNAAIVAAMGLMDGGCLIWEKQSTQEGVQENGGQQREQTG